MATPKVIPPVWISKTLAHHLAAHVLHEGEGVSFVTVQDVERGTTITMSLATFRSMAATIEGAS